MVTQKNLARFTEVFGKVSNLFSTMSDFCGTIDLSKTEILALESIHNHVELKMSELALSLDISFSTATKIVDRLIEKKLVTRKRKNGDRRIVKVMLTKKGTEMVLAYQRQMAEIFEKLLDSLTSEEQENLIGLIEKIAKIGAGKNL